jgi:hypothetical protein
VQDGVDRRELALQECGSTHEILSPSPRRLAALWAL